MEDGSLGGTFITDYGLLFIPFVTLFLSDSVILYTDDGMFSLSEPINSHFLRLSAE